MQVSSSEPWCHCARKAGNYLQNREKFLRHEMKSLRVVAGGGRLTGAEVHPRSETVCTPAGVSHRRQTADGTTNPISLGVWQSVTAG